MQQREVELTDSQWKVARAMLTDGASDETVARRLELTVNTVKTHMRHTYKATDVSSRAALAVEVWSGRLDLSSPRHPSMILDLERSLAA